MDLLTVILNTRYQTRPLHVFGAVGAVIGLTGLAILSYLTVLWFMGAGAIGTRPLFFLGILLSLSSLQFFTVGLLAEFIQRQASGGRPSYFIRSAHNLSPPEGLDADISRLKDAAQLMKGVDPSWPRPQRSEATQRNDIGGNTPMQTRSTA